MELKADINLLKATEHDLKESESHFHTLISSLPTALYTCDAKGYITYYNQAAVDLWGREPVIGEDMWCGSWKIFKPNGEPLPIDECPMAIALKEGIPVYGHEIIIQRPDGVKLNVTPYPTPFFDASGKIAGATNMLIDVTPQRKAAQELRQSELQFKIISSAAPVGLWMTDTNAQNTFVNETWINWTGIPLEKQLGTGWLGSVLEEDKVAAPEKFFECMQKREKYTAEFRIKRPDGEIRWCLTEGYPCYDINGEFTGYAGSVTDITEGKLNEHELERKVSERTKELKNSEERYSRMINEVADYAIILLDKSGCIQNWNKGAEKIKGYKQSEIIGKNFSIFYTPEDQARKVPESLIKMATDTGRAAIEGWRVRKDGTKFWGNILITSLHDDKNNVIGFTKLTRDLTERKMAEESLQAYARQLKEKNTQLEQQKNFVDTILDASVDIISVFDKDLNYLSYNKTCETVYGKPKEEVLGKKLTDVFPETAGTDFHKGLTSAINDKKTSDIIHKSAVNGRYFHTFFVPIKHNSGIDSVLAIAHDITDLLEASEKIKESNRMLEERKLDLEKANTALERSNNDLEQFAYIASHDLQEPLRKIQFFVEKLDKTMTGDDSSRLYFEKIQKASSRMNTLIQDLLDFSRISQDNQHTESTDLNAVINIIKNDLELLVQQKSAVLNIDELPVIEAVPVQMRQLFQNIIGNALKFSQKDRSPVINISSKKLSSKELSAYPGLDQHTDHYCITIQDNGIGFNQQYAEQIFVIFQRLNDLASYGGTGIGLALCKKIVEQHHGDISATSKENEGATFYIILPAKQHAAVNKL